MSDAKHPEPVGTVSMYPAPSGELYGRVDIGPKQYWLKKVPALKGSDGPHVFAMFDVDEVLRFNQAQMKRPSPRMCYRVNCDRPAEGHLVIYVPPRRGSSRLASSCRIDLGIAVCKFCMGQERVKTYTHEQFRGVVTDTMARDGKEPNFERAMLRLEPFA